MGIDLDGTATLGEVQVSSSFLNNNGNAGLRVESTLGTFAGLLVSGTSLHENGANGLSILGTDANTTSPTGVQVVNSTFLNNGSAASAGDGDVSFFRFNGDAGLKDVTITADAQFPIQFRGKGTASPGSWLAAGTIGLTNVDVAGTGARPGLYIVRYSGVTGP